VPDNLIFEGPIRIYTQNKDGIPFVIKSGANAGKPYRRISFTTPEGQTIYLADFASRSAEVPDGGTAKVAYSVKLDGFGEPELYNGNVQYNLEAVKGTGAPQSPQNALPTAQQGHGSPTPHFEQDRNESIRAQTTLKAAAEMYAACLGANKALKWEFEEFERIYTGTKAILDGKNELDVALDSAKAAGMVTEADPELPGPDAPAEEENPDGFPF
jgi:hypothetical protein